ncbi:MAG: preprotein translocase subunit YajC [Desulfovibrionaceae bacterium]|nr:preprotein translocase subunit YajC [Desulfovibrionaceae bacterium]
MFEGIAYAMGTPQGGADASPMAILNGFMPIIIIIAIFYFLMIRPQQKKAKQHQEMLRNLRKGDAVVTNGGIYGRIIEFQDDIAVLDLGEHKIFIMRSALTLLNPNQRSPVAQKKTKKSAKTVETEENNDNED